MTHKASEIRTLDGILAFGELLLIPGTKTPGFPTFPAFVIQKWILTDFDSP